MNVLVPVRPTPTSERIERAVDRTRNQPDREIMVFHRNEVHEDKSVNRAMLQEAVGSRFEGLEVTYVVRTASSWRR